MKVISLDVRFGNLHLHSPSLQLAGGQSCQMTVNQEASSLGVNKLMSDWLPGLINNMHGTYTY